MSYLCIVKQKKPPIMNPFSNLNRDYLVKVSTPSDTRGRLVGVHGLCELITSQRAELLYNKVCRSRSSVNRFKVKGMIISFYYR